MTTTKKRPTTKKTKNLKTNKHQIKAHESELKFLKKDLPAEENILMESQDGKVETRYFKGTEFINLKKAAKSEFLTGSTPNSKQPLILLFASEMSQTKEFVSTEFLFNLLNGMSVLDAKVVVIDSSQRSDLHDQLDQKITFINPLTDFDGESGAKSLDKLLIASDLAITLKNQPALIQLLQSYGVVLIGKEDGINLENYSPMEEKGNSFTYKSFHEWAVFEALVRALETYKFPYDWNNIVRDLIK